MFYRCDSCGCYLDPGDGRLCEECKESIMRKKKFLDSVKESLFIDEYQIEMRLEEMV